MTPRSRREGQSLGSNAGAPGEIRTPERKIRSLVVARFAVMERPCAIKPRLSRVFVFPGCYRGSTAYMVQWCRH